MPIKINLMAEMQAAEEMRRRDPVKRTIFIAVSVVAVALGWSFLVGAQVFLAKGREASVQTSLDAKTNAFLRAKVDLGKVAVERGKLIALDKLQAARFLQGDLMNALQQATVDGVQLTRMRLEQFYEVGGGGGPNTPAHSTERMILHLSAKDFSANPGDQVNKFKEALAKQSYLQTILDKTNAVQLTSPPSEPQTDAGKPYVTFTLDCRLAEHTR